MEDKNIGIIIAIIIVIVFFGGWYIFIGQALSGPSAEAPVTPEIETSSNPIVYGTSTVSTSTQQNKDTIESLPGEGIVN